MKAILTILIFTLCLSFVSCSNAPELPAEEISTEVTEEVTEEVSTLEEQANDFQAYFETELLISSIGRVSSNSGEIITAARDSYDALDENQKELVSNYDTLVWAEYSYDFISTAASNGIEKLIQIYNFKPYRKYTNSDALSVELYYRNLTERTIEKFEYTIQGFDKNGNIVKKGTYSQHTLYDSDAVLNYNAANEWGAIKPFGGGTWSMYYPTTAVSFKIIAINIDYCDGTQISLTPDEISKVIY